MQEKVFLRRKVFIGINIVNIAMNLSLALNEAIRGKDQLLFRIATAIYSVTISVLMYIFTIQMVSVIHMLNFIYLGLINFLALFLIILCRFLLRFEADVPYAILFESVPVLCIASVSLATTMFVIIVRRYIIQGLISPISVQREKGIELAIVLVRREYPEIFQ